MIGEGPGTVDLDFRPSTPEELEICLADPIWRVCSGALYKIMTKKPGGLDGETTAIPFRPNRHQRRFIRRMWFRNLTLKARQLGMTTLVCILWLDHALFVPDQRCGIISYDRDSAEAIMRDKVLFAYNNLPPEIREVRPLVSSSRQEIMFANNSSIRCAVTMRSGTIHRLLVSEYGKMCARFPLKAAEVQTGSLQAVPLDGIVIIESTAEGQEGDFYAKSQEAIAVAEMGRPLTKAQYRLHFYPWWAEDGYAMPGPGAVLSPQDLRYFAETEARIGRAINDSQRAWYVAKRRADLSDDPAKMWQEYPSYPQEAFQQSTEGTYYAPQMAAARVEGRITAVPYIPGIPVNTFWDIGSKDGTGIWFHQVVQGRHNFLRYYEAYGEGYDHFVAEMQKTGWIWGRNFLPHDADHKRQEKHGIASPKDKLRALTPGWDWEIVPAVDRVINGIQIVRNIFPACWFDEAGCKEGLRHLASYRKEWNHITGAWRDEPRHDEHSEAADAFRQFAQALEGLVVPGIRQTSAPRRSRVSARAA